MSKEPGKPGAGGKKDNKPYIDYSVMFTNGCAVTFGSCVVGNSMRPTRISSSGQTAVEPLGNQRESLKHSGVASIQKTLAPMPNAQLTRTRPREMPSEKAARKRLARVLTEDPRESA